MKYMVKAVEIALRYDMLGQPIKTQKVEFETPIEIHPYTLNVPKGFYTGTTKVGTRYGEYKIDISVDKKTGKCTAQYSHPRTAPAPVGVELQVVNE